MNRSHGQHLSSPCMYRSHEQHLSSHVQQHMLVCMLLCCANNTCQARVSTAFHLSFRFCILSFWFRAFRHNTWCVLLYVRVYTDIYVCVPLYVCVCTFICICVYPYIYVCVPLYVCVCTLICTWVTCKATWMNAPAKRHGWTLQRRSPIPVVSKWCQ